MEANHNFVLIWAFYLLASGIFYTVYWRLTAFRRRLWLSYSLRALMAALILTPWYANTQDAVMAPALMVTTLDAITIGTEAAVRALVPLLLALLAAEVLACLVWFGKTRGK